MVDLVALVYPQGNFSAQT